MNMQRKHFKFVTCSTEKHHSKTGNHLFNYLCMFLDEIQDELAEIMVHFDPQNILKA